MQINWIKIRGSTTVREQRKTGKEGFDKGIMS